MKLDDPPNPLLCDIRDSISDTSTRTALQRGSYEIETGRIFLRSDCSMHTITIVASSLRRVAARSAAVVSIFPSTMTYIFDFRRCDNLNAGSTSRTH